MSKTLEFGVLCRLPHDAGKLMIREVSLERLRYSGAKIVFDERSLKPRSAVWSC